MVPIHWWSIFHPLLSMHCTDSHHPVNIDSTLSSTLSFRLTLAWGFPNFDDISILSIGTTAPFVTYTFQASPSIHHPRVYSSRTYTHILHLCLNDICLVLTRLTWPDFTANLATLLISARALKLCTSVPCHSRVSNAYQLVLSFLINACPVCTTNFINVSILLVPGVSTVLRFLLFKSYVTSPKKAQKILI